MQLRVEKITIKLQALTFYRHANAMVSIPLFLFFIVVKKQKSNNNQVNKKSKNKQYLKK